MAGMSITALPVELLTSVCSFIELSEWAALRLACSALYNSSLEAFTDKYFRTIRFLVTSAGLHGLEGLASNKFIRARVQELWIMPIIFPSRHNNNMSFPEFESSKYVLTMRNGRVVKAQDLENRYSIYQATFSDNCALFESEDFTTRLYKCFDHFSNLKAIGLLHYQTTFLLDRRQYEYRCLGSRILRDQADCVFYCLDVLALCSNDLAALNALAISRLFQALERSKIKLTSFHTCGADLCGSIFPDLSLTQVQYNSLLWNLKNLEHLHLCISYGNWFPDDPTTTANLLIAVAPSLKSLVFSQSNRIKPKMSRRLFLNLAQNVKFTRLREIHLHDMEIKYDSFKLFLDTAKETLRVLTLDSVEMGDDTLLSRDPSSWNNFDSTGIKAFWQLIWHFVGNELSLRTFHIKNIGWNGIKLLILEPGAVTPARDSARFDAEAAGISLREWISQLTAVFPGDKMDYVIERHWNWFEQKLPQQQS